MSNFNNNNLLCIKNKPAFTNELVSFEVERRTKPKNKSNYFYPHSQSIMSSRFHPPLFCTELSFAIPFPFISKIINPFLPQKIAKLSA